MIDHRLIVAKGFCIAGAVVGAPCALSAVGLGAVAFTVGAGAAAPRPDHLNIGDYGLVGILSNSASFVGGVLSLFNGIAAWVFGLMAAASLMVALLAGLVYLVGRGLRANAGWARLLAGLVTGVMTFNSLVALALLRGGARLADLCLLAVLGYVLWVLAVRFEPRRRKALPQA